MFKKVKSFLLRKITNTKIYKKILESVGIILTTGIEGRNVFFEKTALFIAEKFKEYNIENYFFTYGSSLSLLRDGHISAKQGDIDIAILEDEAEKILQLLQKEPRFLVPLYLTECSQEKKNRVIKRETLTFPLLNDPSKERLAILKVYDTLNLVAIDFYILYRYEDERHNNGYMIINDIPWNTGKSWYHSFAEYADGVEDISLPSMVYPEYMRLAPEKYPAVHFVSYRLMKSARPWLDRVYKDWDIRRMEVRSRYYYADLLAYAHKQNQIPGFYYKINQHAMKVYKIKEGTNYLSRFRGCERM